MKRYFVSINGWVPLLCQGDSAVEALEDFKSSATFCDELDRICSQDHIVTLTIKEEK